jgi:hypothetical protein
MRRTSLGVVWCVFAGLVAVAPVSAAAPLSASQVAARFDAAAGRKPTVDRRLSRPGHYTALRLSQSVSNVALYGDFVLWVIGPATLEADVADRLADSHTGVVGVPGAAAIHWEAGTSLSGQPYFLAKKRYGTNVVLWRYGPTRKVDASFKRLHKLLTKLVSGAPVRASSSG